MSRSRPSESERFSLHNNEILSQQEPHSPTSGLVYVALKVDIKEAELALILARYECRMHRTPVSRGSPVVVRNVTASYRIILYIGLVTFTWPVLLLQRKCTSSSTNLKN